MTPNSVDFSFLLFSQVHPKHVNVEARLDACKFAGLYQLAKRLAGSVNSRDGRAVHLE